MSRALFISLASKARADERDFLLEPEAAEICKAYGIPVVDHGVAKSVEDAVELAERLGYPVVLKIVSRDAYHKTDVGGVKLGLGSPKEVRKAFDELASSVREGSFNGVLVAKMAPKGLEVIVGMNRNRSFGPVIIFGLGGILVEVLGDVAMRISPIEKGEAYEMLDEIRGSKVLRGYRGSGPVDLDALANIILAVSRMSEENPEISSIDLNPVIAYEKGALVVDPKIAL